tara:strand:- start:898 stop:1077 length:180 start_codon:yes stop_codon:yes gene_type:complete
MKVIIDMKKIGPRMTCPICDTEIKTNEEGIHYCGCEDEDGIWHWVIRRHAKTNMSEYRY